MEELTKKLEKYLGNNRSWTKSIFKIMGSLYRGVTNNRFTLNQGLEKLNKLGGIN